MSDPGVRLVCVVIPYFQREAGVLRRALLSVGAQRLPAEMKVHCIIVDDGSPHSADGEIPELAEHTRVSFSIVRQANGGVSAARNAALDHVPAEASFVACLDSDDIWGPLHLARAIEALDGGADFYFSDCLLDERGTWFSTMPDFEHLLASYCVAETADLAILQADALLASFVEDCPAHTSSTVYRFERYRLVRFERALRNAGEDHLFWFDLVRSADRVAVDRQATVARGHGIDLYRSAQSWDSPECLARLCGNLLKYVTMRARVHKSLLPRIGLQLDQVRQELLVVMLRSLAIRPAKVADALGFVWRSDKAFFARLPANGASVVRRKRKTGRYI